MNTLSLTTPSRSNNKSLLLLGLLFLTACAQTPQKRALSACPTCQTHSLNTQGKHRLVAYSVHLSTKAPSLHVYLEGDGIPWSSNGRPSTNPSSHALTALKLMALDSAPSLYLNRPCYGYQSLPKHCDKYLWTMGRYSDEVVESMQNAIEEFQDMHAINKVILIGHSGGGSLAMLLAQRLEQVVGVVTLAANLDHKTWTEHFSYLPLVGSLNASEQKRLSPSLFRWHFAGSNDRQVPAKITEDAAKKDLNSEYFLLEGYDHNCCWQKSWRKILNRIDQTLKKPHTKKE